MVCTIQDLGRQYGTYCLLPASTFTNVNVNGIQKQFNVARIAGLLRSPRRLSRVTELGLYRRLIPKSAFMQFLAILTFLHIWKNESQGYLKMQEPCQFLQNKGTYCPLKGGAGAKNAVVI